MDRGLRYLFTDKRAQTYLLWAVLTTFGFLYTHANQEPEANRMWVVLSIIGLGFMAVRMPLKHRRMQAIYAAWLLPITFGMIVSIMAFQTSETWAGSIIEHLGAFWLLVMAIGYSLNGIVDAPSLWYWFAAIVNLVLGVLAWQIPAFSRGQYVLAAIASAWSLIFLWLYRSVDD